MSHRKSRREFIGQSGLAGLWLGGAGAVAAETPPARKPLRVVVLEGSPYERGLTHGKTLKEPIGQLLPLWQADLEARYKLKASAFTTKFLQRTDYLPAIKKKWTPELLDEIRGLAKGCDVDFDTMLVFQLMDEYWVQGGAAAGEHCSGLGISRRGNQPTFLAQTMDLEGFRNGFQAVLHIKQPRTNQETLLLTCAGMIGLNGVNSKSVGVCCNTLTQLASCRDGLPVACVVRGLLEQQTEQSALDFLQRVKHASGQNYIVGGPARAQAFECSAGKVSRFNPDPKGETVWHTNHPLANDDYTPAYRAALEKKEPAGNSAVRLQALEKRLAKGPAGFGIEQIKETLASRDSKEHPVCRPFKDAKNNFTFAATIMVLAERPELHFAPGPPDVTPYQTFSFRAGSG